MNLNSRITLKFLVQIGFLFLIVWCIIGATFGFYLYSKQSSPTEGISPSVLLKKLPEATSVNGKPIQVSNNVLTKIKQKGGWLQILDRNGSVIFSFHCPKNVPNNYNPGLLVYNQSNPEKVGYHLYIGYDTSNKQSLTWVYGIPLTQATTGEQGHHPYIYILMLFAGSLLATLLVAIFFGRRMGTPILHMLNWLQNLANKTYLEPTDAKGRPKSKRAADGDLRRPYRIYREVLMTLESLAFSLKQSDLERNRMEQTREEWITGITHDLRTPLSSVKGYADLITPSDYKWTEDEIRGFGQIISDKATYMEWLIDDLSLTFRLKNDDLPLNKRLENIVEVVRRVVIDQVNAPQSEGKTVQFECEEEVITYPLDKKWMTRALDNLLTNSLLHNYVGTTIQVIIGLIHESDAKYSGVRIEIEDNGRGMDTETVEHLFDRYFRGTNTSDQHVKGSGLGTAIAKQLIEAHGGRLSVKSELGQGTKMVIDLPAKN